MADELQLTVCAKIHECATQIFREIGIQPIKPEQLEIVAGIVKGDVFAVLPTSYGMLSVFTEALRQAYSKSLSFNTTSINSSTNCFCCA